jgi:uncharacterized membrane protein
VAAADEGSLPPAEELKAYEAAFPGMGRELLNRAKEEQKHLQEMDRADVTLSQRGQIFGFVIAICFLIAATFLVYTGHGIEGTIIGSTDLVALVAVFVIGKKTSSESADNGISDLLKQLQKSQAIEKRRRKKRRQLMSNANVGTNAGKQPETPVEQHGQTDEVRSPPTDVSHQSPPEDSPPTNEMADPPVSDAAPEKIVLTMSEDDRKLWDRIMQKAPKQNPNG